MTYVWCPLCGVRLTKAEILGWGCPKCKHDGVPCDPEQDVTVEVNWHELKILACFAERWAQQIDSQGIEDIAADLEKELGVKLEVQKTPLASVIYAIAARLERQWDLGALTLSKEISQLVDDAGDLGVNVISNIPKVPAIHEFGPGAVGHSKK